MQLDTYMDVNKTKEPGQVRKLFSAGGNQTDEVAINSDPSEIVKDCVSLLQKEDDKLQDKIMSAPEKKNKCIQPSSVSTQLVGLHRNPSGQTSLVFDTKVKSRATTRNSNYQVNICYL